MSKAPYDSMRFGGSTIAMTPGNPTALAEKPIKLTVRTSAVANQGYWGRCVHDLSGFRAPSGPVPLDYAHQGDDAIGVADSFKVVGGELIATGKIVPFSADDQASKVIFQGSKGIPFQCSIMMDPNGLQVQTVGDGETARVNGTTFAGPGTIFRKWGINGVAILPYGSDSETSVQFGRGKPDVEYKSFSSPRHQRNELTRMVLANFNGKA